MRLQAPGGGSPKDGAAVDRSERRSPLSFLEARVDALLASHEDLRARLAARERDLERLRGDVERYGRERTEMRARLDALLAEVDAAVAATGGRT